MAPEEPAASSGILSASDVVEENAAVTLGRRAARRNSKETAAAAGGATTTTRGGSGGAVRFGAAAATEDSSHDNARAADGQDKRMRQQSLAVHNMRERFLAPVPRLSEVLGDRANDAEAIDQIVLAGTPCSWLACISLSISMITGVPTSVESILRTNHLGVHHLSLPVVTLAQLYDFIDDYLHTRFRRGAACNNSCTSDDEYEDDGEAAKYLTEDEMKLLPHVHCELATMDWDVVDAVGETEASYGMGEHAPVASLAQFRKELVQHNGDERSILVLNFDPYIIEEHETRLRANNAESEEEEAAIWAGMRYKKGQSSGAYGLLVSFNPVQHTVTIVTPHLTRGQHPMHTVAADAAKYDRFTPVLSHMVLEEHTVSLQALYEAMRQRDNYTLMSRGFVRVFVSQDFAPKVPSIFPLFVLDGSSAAGLMTSALDVSIAPHVLGLAMMHHLNITFLLSDSARRKQSSRNLLSKAYVCDVKLRGIPLTKICQQLRLPVSQIVATSNKSSIAMAFAWYSIFLQQLQIGSELRLGLVLPSRRDGAEDGMPNISEEEFLAHLMTTVKTQSVMLISYDINLALNVRVSQQPEPAHFGIVIGVDEERGYVRVADVNVRRFRKTWHIPFYRLYSAVMGYGYMVAAKDKKTIRSLGGKRFQQEALACGRYMLPPVLQHPLMRLEYPSRPYAVTVLADAVNRLGFQSDVERFLNFSGFHITYFLSRHLPLQSAGIVVQNYSHFALDDAISVAARPYDFKGNGAPPAHAVAVGAGNNGSSSGNDKDRAGASAGNGKGVPLTKEDLLAEITSALESPTTRQLLVKYAPNVIARETRVFNGSPNGGSYAIVVELDPYRSGGGAEEGEPWVVLSNCDPEPFYRVFAVPLSLLFRAISSWDREDMRACGTLLLTTDARQDHLYDNTKGLDFAHALVHHPFRPVFSATCACIALAATEMMNNIQAPMLLGGAPLAAEDEEKRKYRRYNNIFAAEDVLYSLPAFSVHGWQSQASHVVSADIAALANTAFAALGLPLVAVDLAPTAEEAAAAEDDAQRRARASMGEVGTTSALADAAAFLRACDGVGGLLTMTLITYDTGMMHGVPGLSVGIVNRITTPEDREEAASSQQPQRRGSVAGSAGAVQLLEGEPTRWGSQCERRVEELMPMVRAVICIMENEQAE